MYQIFHGTQATCLNAADAWVYMVHAECLEDGLWQIPGTDILVVVA